MLFVLFGKKGRLRKEVGGLPRRERGQAADVLKGRHALVSDLQARRGFSDAVC